MSVIYNLISISTSVIHVQMHGNDYCIQLSGYVRDIKEVHMRSLEGVVTCGFDSYRKMLHSPYNALAYDMKFIEIEGQ